MNAMNVFMNLAKAHSESIIRSTESDIEQGFRFGLEKAMEEMANLPELANDYAVKAVIERLAHGMAALPIKNGSGRQWWEDPKAFELLSKMEVAA